MLVNILAIAAQLKNTPLCCQKFTCVKRGNLHAALHVLSDNFADGRRHQSDIRVTYYARSWVYQKLKGDLDPRLEQINGKQQISGLFDGITRIPTYMALHVREDLIDSARS